MTTSDQLKLAFQQVMSPVSHFQLANPFSETWKLMSSNNYLEWKRRFEKYLLLASEHIYQYYKTGQLNVQNDVLIDESVIQECDIALKVLLLKTLSQNVIDVLDQNVMSGFDHIRAIDKTYGNISLRGLLLRYKKMNKDSPSPLEHIRNFRMLAEDLKFIAPDLETVEVLLCLSTLNDDSLEDKLFVNKLERLSFMDLQNAYAENELRPSFAYTINQSKQMQDSKSSKKKKIICTRCQKEGHKSFECRAPAPVSKKSLLSDETGKDDDTYGEIFVAEAFRTMGEVYTARNLPLPHIDDAYWFDSGATCHISNNRNHFSSFEKYHGYLQGLSSGCQIEGKGTVLLYHNGKDITLTDVYYVPEAGKNLIAFCKVFKAGGIRVDESGLFVNNKLFATYQPNRLFKCIFSPQYCAQANLVMDSHSHQRFGHPSEKTSRKLGLPILKELCASCQFGRNTATFPKVSRTVVKAPLELLHVDVCGPFNTKGTQNERFFLTIVDRFTHMVAVYPLQHKSQVSQLLKEYITYAENHFHRFPYKVMRVRSDNGTEFCNNQLLTFFKQKGIQHELTNTYSSYQNGVAERMHRTLISRVRILLASSGCPDMFWPQALKFVALIISQEPSSSIHGDIPHMRWFDSQPDYTMYHPFGCQAYPLTPSVHRSSKLSPVSTSSIFMGVSARRKAYIFHDPIADSFTESQHATFSDSHFPFLHQTRKSVGVPIFDLSESYRQQSSGILPSLPNPSTVPILPRGISDVSSRPLSHSTSVPDYTPSDSMDYKSSDSMELVPLDHIESNLESISDPGVHRSSLPDVPCSPTVDISPDYSPAPSVPISSKLIDYPVERSLIPYSQSAHDHSTVVTFAPRPECPSEPSLLPPPTSASMNPELLTPVIPAVHPRDPFESDVGPDPPRYPMRRLNADVSHALLADAASAVSSSNVPTSVT
ncbi:hypothetical protein OGATHE_000126, partial [Ogataea polymorpha]